MDLANAIRLNATLPPSAVVVDVGGGGSVFPRANYVIDLCPFEKRNPLGELSSIPARYSAETWIQKDLCERTPWPFPDKFFDYATCSHVLEDVRDPIWICSEINRISKAGYIETPSRVLEQSKGVENPLYAGYYHHRWLVEAVDGTVELRHKPHNLHALKDAIVAHLGPNERIAGAHSIVVHEWTGELRAKEVIIFDQTGVEDELIAFAANARKLHGIVESRGFSGTELIRRHLYWQRLGRGVR